MSTNKIILGTVQFGMPYGVSNLAGMPMPETVYSILSCAYDNGVRELDTADKYGDALQLISSFHDAHPQKKFRVNGKFTGQVFGENKTLSKHVTEQLRMLGLQSYQSYLFHRFDDLNKIEFRDEMAKMKRDDLILQVGVSIYTNEEFQAAADDPLIDVIQIPYNLLDSGLEKRELILRAKEQRKIIHARSIFLQGLFFMGPTTLPEKTRVLAESVQAVNDIAVEAGMTIEQLALAFVLQNTDLDGILIGVDTREQLKRNLGYINTVLPSDLIGLIEKIPIKEPKFLNPTNWQ